MFDILWNWLLKNWFYILPYFMVVAGTHFLKNYLSFIQSASEQNKGAFVLLLSFLISIIINFAVVMFAGFNFWLFIILSLACWMISGFLTVFVDKINTTNLFDWIMTFLKNFLTGSKNGN